MRSKPSHCPEKGRPSVRPILRALALIAAVSGLPAASAFAGGSVSPTVLVINSYAPNFDWTATVYDGLVDALDASGLDYQLYTEYLDWKRFPTKENLDSLREVFAFKYRNLRIDMIITTDNAALDFALDNRAKIFSGAPIVFTGVLPGPAMRYITANERITGVFENIDPAGTVRAALAVNPKLTRVYLFNERSETGRETEQLSADLIRIVAPNIGIESLSDLPFADLEREIPKLPENSIILVGTCYTEVEAQVYSMDSAIRRITQASSVPVYVMYKMLMSAGALGGSLLDGRELGRETARLAAEELRSEVPYDELPVNFSLHSLTFSAPVMKRFGIPESRIPRGAEILERRVPLYAQHPILSFLFIDAVLVMLAAIGFLTRNNRRIRKLAYKDNLTGLVNQLHVFETTDRILAKTDDSKKTGLLHIDIDNFRLVNDVYGHAFGDLVLKETARRLSTLVSAHVRVARFGGDEFLALVFDVDFPEIPAMARAVQGLFAENMSINGRDLKVAFTIGIAVYPDHGREFRQLLQNADMAMHRGKHGGKSRSVFFDFGMSRELTSRIDLEHSLSEALRNGELFVVFQPQVNLKTFGLSGFESLLRWNSARHGSVSPAEFVPVAENSDLIIGLGDFVMRETLRFVRECERLGHGGFTVSVNVSVRQFGERDIAKKFLAMAEEQGVAPERIVLEVTESVMIEGIGEISEKLRELREAGFRIALDDFGTGYSSLNYLRELPINIVKIDKSFIDSLHTDQRSQPLTRHIIGLCHELGLSVLAEGIETREQSDFLSESDCDVIQGYYYSKPLSRETALNVLGKKFPGAPGD